MLLRWTSQVHGGSIVNRGLVCRVTGDAANLAELAGSIRLVIYARSVKYSRWPEMSGA